MVKRKKLAIRRNPVVVPPKEEPIMNDEDLIVNDEDATVVPDDDCDVVDDDDDELEENRNDDDDANDSEEDAENEHPEDLPSEQEVSAILASRFGEDVINEAEQSDGDSADDIDMLKFTLSYSLKLRDQL
ncbi:hypothetical protein AALP_AAs48387U000400 [Arabis alpina]|uniref:Uncharacterized protein n=1 Tax=Arabis alpina TaxID=50452 RepID=A0A087G2B5_ARAAL|nr:hypothetical protein AALP_AAs48387U000400 [Arabis alpina]